VFSYVQNNPVNRTDPFGLKECEKRNCEIELGEHLATCAANYAIVAGACNLVCKRTGPLSRTCYLMCKENIADPIRQNCLQIASADYAKCKASQ